MTHKLEIRSDSGRYKENEIVKYKFIVSVLALAVASWAQSTNTTQAPAGTDKANAEIKCAGCDKMSLTAKSEPDDHKHACMHASAKDGKEASSCCSGKDEASCCKDKDGKSCTKTATAGCCGEKCTDMKDCCSTKDSKNTAHNCCGSGRCGHKHHEPPTTGN